MLKRGIKWVCQFILCIVFIKQIFPIIENLFRADLKGHTIVAVILSIILTTALLCGSTMKD